MNSSSSVNKTNVNSLAVKKAIYGLGGIFVFALSVVVAISILVVFPTISVLVGRLILAASIVIGFLLGEYLISKGKQL